MTSDRDDTATDWAEARARLATATPRPWVMVGEHHAGRMIGAMIRSTRERMDVAYVASTVHDAELIVHAPDDLVVALSEIEQLRAALNRVAEQHQPRTITVCMDDDQHGGESCDCGTTMTVCSYCYGLFVEVTEPYTEDHSIPVDVMHPCKVAAATVLNPADVSHCPHCARPLPHNETEQTACGGEQR